MHLYTRYIFGKASIEKELVRLELGRDQMMRTSRKDQDGNEGNERWRKRKEERERKREREGAEEGDLTWKKERRRGG